MLIRISLIVAIIAGLAVGALNFITVRNKITTLISERDEWKGKYETTYAELTKTKSDLNKTKTELTQTKTELDATKSERDKAVAEATTQRQRAGALADELTKTKKERDESQAELAAYRVSNLTPQEVANLGKRLKSREDMLAEATVVNKGLQQKMRQLETELAIYRSPEIHILLPAKLTGKILVSDPKWEFVVLNVGEDQGVLKHGQFLVNRDGRLVAKLTVTTVQKDRCIANVMPGWKLGEVMEGDIVIPAYPDQSS